MLITCPKEFYEAVQFAKQADELLEAAISETRDEATRLRLADKRGQAVRTLMECFAWRANSDALDNANPHLPDSSEVVYPGGSARPVSDCRAFRCLPVVETVICPDFSRHSFFFRERWIDLPSRQEVEIRDRCWYVFRDGTTQKTADGMSEDELEALLPGSRETASVTFWQEDADKAKAEGAAVRQAMKRRHMLNGGIIFHEDHVDGKKTGYGSWSTHT